MNFGYRNGVIYLHSAQEGRSISILERNPKVCITFSTDHDLVFQHPEVACSYRMRSKSVIAWGKVRFEEDFDKENGSAGYNYETVFGQGIPLFRPGCEKRKNMAGRPR